jgi:4-hydroxy-tetrahydrodipicolinate synthase
MPQDPVMFCMVATPFKPDNSIDEDGLRAHIRRLVAARNGLYLAGGGAGEGHMLTLAEFRRICEIGVEEGKGKVPTYTNPRESRSAAAMYDYAKEAVKAGVDCVQLYQLEGGHGMVPNQVEQEAYWTELLDAIKHPVAISVHAYSGFRPRPGYLKELHQRYPQIIAINVMGGTMAYLMEVRDEMPAAVACYTGINTVVQGLALGAAGALEAESNIIPNICQSILDQWKAGDTDKLSRSVQTVQRFATIVNQWAPSTARWVKLAMRVLDLPGGRGPLRKPYVMPGPEDEKKMAAAFEKMGLRALEGLPKSKVPATA